MTAAQRVVYLLLDADDDEHRFAAVVVLRNPDDPETLLVRREVEPEKGKWACPGGHAEEGEAMESAARRELKEETHIEADDLSFMEKKPAPGMDDGIVYIYYAVVGAGEKAVADDDAEKVKWVKVTSLPDLAFGNNAHVEAAVKAAFR
jgi:8-oxo-dGTP diphosphatase